MTMPVAARGILRGIVSAVAVAVAAGLVFLFDNKLSDTGLTVLLGSIAVIFVCGLIWWLFDLGERSD
jgi:dolichyl-phosphate-mannose--protein O-mannosyl transferase